MEPYYDHARNAWVYPVVRTGKYIVGSLSSDDNFSTSNRPAIHDTEKAARKEAARLTRETGKRMVVLEVKGICEKSDVVWS